eukprot:TRINITY_DN12093_c0_g1_i2.p1 TRINITY_DN12093_c0_g1~~TRINITY_DN12093_c0_g1_i2.p1  ORF type:complete len:273 (-),score=23.26 TRINITY_DN12093_c0_g1_i2:76-894(-)
MDANPDVVCLDIDDAIPMSRQNTVMAVPERAAGEIEWWRRSADFDPVIDVDSDTERHIDSDSAACHLRSTSNLLAPIDGRALVYGQSLQQEAFCVDEHCPSSSSSSSAPAPIPGARIRRNPFFIHDIPSMPSSHPCVAEHSIAPTLTDDPNLLFQRDSAHMSDVQEYCEPKCVDLTCGHQPSDGSDSISHSPKLLRRHLPRNQFLAIPSPCLSQTPSSARDPFAFASERLGVNHVRPWQRAVLERWLVGEDTLILSGTGSGKSLCFQPLIPP